MGARFPSAVVVMSLFAVAVTVACSASEPEEVTLETPPEAEPTSYTAALSSG